MLSNCKIINFDIAQDERGKLLPIEGGKDIPFEIRRVYYLFDIPLDAFRGGHAHKDLHQIIIAISGSFDVHIDDGHGKKTFHLNKSTQGLYICPMIWREIDNFSGGAVCLVLASDIFKESDYYRDYSEFKSNINIY
jgi:hypothetical protein